MVQHSPFTSNEDPNLHLQAFIQLCKTFNMVGVTQNQMNARLFLFLLLGKLCNGSTLNRRRWCKIGRLWWDLSWRSTTHQARLKVCIIRLLLLLNTLQRLFQELLSVTMSTLGLCHIISSERRILFKSSIKDLPWH
jgi:hypothetical protein